MTNDDPTSGIPEDMHLELRDIELHSTSRLAAILRMVAEAETRGMDRVSAFRRAINLTEAADAAHDAMLADRLARAEEERGPRVILTQEELLDWGEE